MVRLETGFACADALTPDIAARLAQRCEKYRAALKLECDGKQVLLDSLIGILSVPCTRGKRLTVIAEGDDAQAAAEDIRDFLEGK